MYIIDTSQETFLKKSCSCHVVVDGAVVYLVLDNPKIRKQSQWQSQLQ